MNASHPFDTYVTDSVTDIANSIIADKSVSSVDDDVASQSNAAQSQQQQQQPIVRLGYDTRPGRLVALQRLAHAVGLGYYNTESCLVTHPVYGPWFALYVGGHIG